MRVQQLLATCRQADIILIAEGDRLTFDAPVGVMTPARRAALRERKPELLQVLWRLEGMRQHPEPVPTAKSATEAPGGPGHCFSCGAALDHPQAYGRCTWCGIAVECYYTERGKMDEGDTLIVPASSGEKAR